MTTKNAREFIKRLLHDKELYKEITAASTAKGDAGRTEILEREGLTFNQDEFAQAHSSLLVKCQDESDADVLHQIRMWWNLLLMG